MFQSTWVCMSVVSLLPSGGTPALGNSRPAEDWTSSSWRARILEDARREEYCFHPVIGGQGGWSAPSRAQGFRFRVSPEGLEVVPRTKPAEATGTPWKLRIRTKGYGRGKRTVELAPLTLSVDGARACIEHDDLLEWFENRQQGLEHGWTIAERPAGAGFLWIDLEISSELLFEIETDARGARLCDTNGVKRLEYGELSVLDSTGRELPATMQRIPGGIGIRIDDAHASYPVIVDPLLQDPAWTAEGDQSGELFGYSVACAGDINGDGYDDVIVGAPKFDQGQVDEGRALLFLGSATGLSTTASWTATGDLEDAWFGWSVASAGDVNGDGFDDVAVGAPIYTNGQYHQGRGYVYLGSAGGLDTTEAWLQEGTIYYADFGYSIATAGDVNGDGYDDLIVGAPSSDNGATSYEGEAFVYLGSAGGLATTAAWSAGGNQSFANYGKSVASAGDIDGDGYADVIVGAPGYTNSQLDEGRAYVYLGSSIGLSATEVWRIESNQNHAQLGHSVASAGDINGDGFDDVIVGTPYYNHGVPDVGLASVYLGSAAGLATTPAWTSEGEQEGELYGISVAGPGDLDSDGYADIIVGAQGFDHGEIDEGGAFVYRGSVSGLRATPAWRAESDEAGALFGSAVAGTGDVDGDGHDDVVIGANSHDGAMGNVGQASVYLGCGGLGDPYCSVTPNSSGGPAVLSAWCSSSAAAGRLRLDASPVPNQFGIFFHGTAQTEVTFGNGYLCTSGNIVRGAVGKAAAKLATYSYDNTDSQHDLAAWVGSTRHFQYWFRDPLGGGALFNTSNALSIAILP